MTAFHSRLSFFRVICAFVITNQSQYPGFCLRFGFSS